ncbi:hypothetical protein EYE40_05580 [Glaciihabitans arcticus]|uniref:DUF2157 domain-containing protein n=1 Tax=Glaciihabitans arcticus TaxID=2668039 RepID=A0A4Q9GQQ4_9MICO|nr:hypothetical protein [Glaciihabitans arcticus]TBN56915.1 hypothetical protein EYE40_05580 [Glaciihabitans arcticus]
MSKPWSDNLAEYLTRSTSCPRCDNLSLESGWCPRCGADLSGLQAVELMVVSQRAALAVTERQALIEQLPTVRRPAAVPVAVPSSAVASVAPRVVLAPGPRPSSQISVQSVLAVAGAGLFAIAAMVFTFLNPDLTDFTTRSLVVAGVTAVFLGGAWFLAAKGLQFSAETVGALGTVFLALDVWAISTLAWPGVSDWLLGALATLVSSAALVAVAALARVRSWLWVGIVGLIVTPAMVGYGFGAGNSGYWPPILGHVAVGFAAYASHSLARRLSARFGSPLFTERTTATILALTATGIVLLQLAFYRGVDDAAHALGSAAVLAVLAVLAGWSTRNQLAAPLSVTSGVLAVTAAAIVPLALTFDSAEWMLAAVSAAAGLAVALLALFSRFGGPGTLRRPLLLAGAWGTALFAAGPAVLVVAVEYVLPLADFDVSSLGLAAIAGIAAVTLSTALLSMLARPAAPGVASSASTASLWLAVLGLVSVAAWTGWLYAGRVAIAVGIAIGLILLLSLVPRIVAWPTRLRAPLVTGAHALVLLAAAVAWAEPGLNVWGGAAVAASGFTLAFIVPKALRPVHIGLAYAYTLLIFATALDLAGLELIATLCLTTSLASISALVVTLLRLVPARIWYSVLIVTAVPFLMGIVSVLTVRSGWTGLSTAVTFALALTLVLTRREGLGRALRSLAAATLVPSLAVVVICLGAEFLLRSASPVTLPIIAGLVALTLPLTGRIAAALERHGLSPADIAAVRLWIEVSSLVTAALAVLLSLAREAAGPGTSFLVLVIIGLGAGATALFSPRRWAWPVSFAAFTGALWSIWALVGVEWLEAYSFPPAIAGAIIGFIAVARGRGRSGVPFYGVGIGFAIAPSLFLLAINERADGFSGGLWRTLALLGASLLLLALAARLPVKRWPDLTTLRVPTLVFAIAAAAAGTLQGLRYGQSVDVSAFADQWVLVPVLLLGITAAGLAAAAGRMLAAHTESRWIYAPALVLLALGPIGSVRVNEFTVAVLWSLSVLLLALMVYTVVRARSRATQLPPVWFQFAVAWSVAVAGWSTRDFLRVEAFSLVLGLALLIAGILAMKQTREVKPSPASWPLGYTGSWQLLVPGIVVTLLPSVLATGTDPVTWRAILVIALALVAILVGSLRKLAAPFIIGMTVLPIENVIVFAVQIIGGEISPAAWWMTLATAGAVLLVIAVTYERRTSSDRGVVARLRDLT